MAQIEEEKREHHNKMLKMEREMEEVFERKVKEKQRKLRDSETDLDRRHKESMEKLEQQKRELEAKISAFAQVILNFTNFCFLTLSKIVQFLYQMS